MNYVLALAALLLVGIWSPGASALTAQDRAACIRMAQHMGLGEVHEHKGISTMSITHRQCRKLLRQARGR